MSRPRLPVGAKRAVKVLVSFTAEEAAGLDGKAAARGMSRQAAIRAACEAWLGLPDHREVTMPRVVTIPSVPTVPMAPPANTEPSAADNVTRTIPADDLTVPHDWVGDTSHAHCKRCGWARSKAPASCPGK